MRDTIKTYMQPAFIICVAVLALAGGVMSFAIKGFSGLLSKTPLPLKKSLDFLDQSDLTPYKVVSKYKIENKDIVKSLGTEDYIQWQLEDTDLGDSTNIGNCILFITYYELPDRVPHVPEECYGGTDHQRLATESIAVAVGNNDAERTVKVRHLVFAGMDFKNWVSSTKFSVLYLINVNGTYCGNRDEARIALNKNIFGKHSYFCKVEWYFVDSKFHTRLYLNKEQAISAGQKLLGVILPILEKEHWPQLEK